MRWSPKYLRRASMLNARQLNTIRCCEYRMYTTTIVVSYPVTFLTRAHACVYACAWNSSGIPLCINVIRSKLIVVWLIAVTKNRVGFKGRKITLTLHAYSVYMQRGVGYNIFRCHMFCLILKLVQKQRYATRRIVHRKEKCKMSRTYSSVFVHVYTVHSARVFI